MDQKHHLRIIDFKVVPFKDKRTGADSALRLAQCIITSKTEEGGQKSIVGELMMPKHLADTPAGEYLAEFELAVDRDLRVGSRLSKLHPFGASAKPIPKAA